MSAKTKIVVLRRKELFITVVLTAVGVLLLIALLSMLLPGGAGESSGIAAQDGSVSASEKGPAAPDAAENASSDQIYTPGIYTTELVLGGQSVDVEVIVSETAIESIRLVNLEESVTTMYPLLEPTLESICEQIYETQSLDGVTYADDSKYTSLVLMEAIQSALDTAAPTEP